MIHYPAGIYLLKVNNRNNRKRRETCSKLTIRTTERRQWRRRRFSVFIVNFEHISHLSLVFLLSDMAEFFFCLGFLSQPFRNHRTAGEGGPYHSISLTPSLPLPPTSQTLRNQSGNYCRELTSAHIGSSRNKPRTFGFRAQVANH